jgi:ABC-type transport system substrate-binding protein
MKHTSYANPVYKIIEGGEELFQGKISRCSGIKIIDNKQFEIKLVNENVEFSNYFTAVIMSVLPIHRNSGNEKKLFSGPFQVVKQEQKKNKLTFILEKNPWYCGKKPNLDTLFIHVYREDEDFQKAIMKGELDLFLYNNRFDMPKSRYSYNYFKTPILGGFYFKVNPKNGPFKNKQLRNFFKYFVRSQDIIRNENWVLTIPLSLVLPYNMTGYFVFNPIPENDFKPYAPKTEVTVKCINPTFGIREELFSMLKKKLKKYNVSLDIQWKTMTDIHKMEEKGTVDLTTIYYIADIPLSSYFYETLFIPGHELNLFAYEVPEALALLDSYREEKDEIKKLKILSRLEEIAQEEAFLIPLLNPLSLLGYKNNIKNVNIDKFLSINFEVMDVKN